MNVTLARCGLSKRRQETLGPHRLEDLFRYADLTCSEALPNVVAGEADHGELIRLVGIQVMIHLGRPETLYCRKENGPR